MTQIQFAISGHHIEICNRERANIDMTASNRILEAQYNHYCQGAAVQLIENNVEIAQAYAIIAREISLELASRY